MNKERAARRQPFVCEEDFQEALIKSSNLFETVFCFKKSSLASLQADVLD